MNRGSTIGMALRMATGFAVGILIITDAPSWWLTITSPAVEIMVDAGCPYLDDLRMQIEQHEIRADGTIQINMILANGESLPAVPGTWRKHGQHTLNVLVVAIAIWLAPAAGWRRRLVALAGTLSAAALASAFILAVEIQEAALGTIGYDWLPSIPLASTPENVQTFRQMERWYETVTWIKAFHDGGGRLFLGMLAGFIGYALPAGLKLPGSKNRKKQFSLSPLHRATISIN